MDQVVVTGGLGYIGSHCCLSIMDNKKTPLIIDNQINSYRQVFESIKNYNLKHKPQLYPLGCEGINNIGHNSVSGIIHFAALKSVGESVQNPLLYYKNNLDSLISVLAYIENHQIQNFVFSSSCTVYGEPKTCPINETFPIATAYSPYGQTKIICEQIIHDFYKTHPHLNCTILRYFNPIGARPDVPLGENPKRPAESLVARLMRYACGLDTFKIYGDDYETPDGTAVRDYLDVNDLASCHTECLKHMEDKQGFFKTYNVGTGRGTSVLEIVEIFKEISGMKNLSIEIGPRRPGDVSSIYADASLLWDEIGFRCTTDIYTSLTDAWNWQGALNETCNKFTR